MTGSYDDIIHLPHPEPVGRLRMSIADRAAQFSPFSALTGYDEAVKEVARLTSKKLHLTEDAQDALDRKQQYLMKLLPAEPIVSVTCFCPDSRKNGGSYKVLTGQLKKIDQTERILVFANGQVIPGDQIIDVACDLLPDFL